MKSLFTALLGVFVLTEVLAQAPAPGVRELTPARGQYKQLAPFSSKPKSANEEIDKQKFFTEPAVVERRLSIKPVYLQNVTVDDFQLPDVPANSSEKTRAEINYLLSLQKYR